MNWPLIGFTGLFIFAVAAVIVKDFIESWKEKRDFDEYLKRKLEEKGE